MAKHNSQAAQKAARNAAYAERFPRRSRSDRKKARAQRVAERRKQWCLAHGIDPTPPAPLKDLLRGGRRRRLQQPSPQDAAVERAAA